MRYLKRFKVRNPKGKDLNVFVRFGGLDLKNQLGYNKQPETYHSPPAPRGFYAMPKIAQEFFLIGSIDKFQPDSLPKTKSKDSFKNEDEYFSYLDGLEKNRKLALRKLRKEFTKSDGNIWHHLVDYVDRNEIIDSHGSWVKTSLSAWRKAFSKSSLKDRYGIGDFSVNSIDKSSGVTGDYSKDHYEVFFDEKV
jgi:hypothetical protein